MSGDQRGLPLRSVRARLLADWDPSPAEARFSTWEANNLEAVWRELAAVESVSAWRAFVALSGQLIESHLKQRLLQGGRDFARVSQQALGPLIQMAIKDGVFQTGEAELTVGRSIFAAKQLRNWASHGSAWQRSPRELQATSALAMLVSTSGTFFAPTLPERSVGPQDHSWWLEHGATAHPSDAAHALAAGVAGQSVSEDVAEVMARQIVRLAGPSALLNLHDLLARLPFGRALFRRVIADEFVHVLGNLGRGRLRSAVELVQRTHSAKLRGESRLIALCLPRTPDALEHYLSRSSHRFAQYVMHVKRADPETFDRWLTMENADARLITGLERVVRERKGSLANLSLVVQELPRPLVVRLLERCGHDVAAWAADDLPGYTLNLVKLCDSRSLRTATEVRQLERRVLEGLRDRIEPTPLEDLRGFIMRALSLGLIEHEGLAPLWPALIESARTSADGVAVQEVLWDAWQCLPDHREHVMRVVVERLQPGDPLDAWSHLALAGVAVLDGVPVTVGTAEVRDAARAARSHVWELLRVALVCLAQPDPETRAASAPILELTRARLTDLKVDRIGTGHSERLAAAVRADLTRDDR